MIDALITSINTKPFWNFGSKVAFCFLKYGDILMELIYTMPEEVIHYNRVFEQWNEMVSVAQNSTVESAINTVTQWWENYAQETNSKKIVEKYDVPRNVWKILEKFKINHTEKIYGIYYTLKLVLGEDAHIEVSAIQYDDSGSVDVVVLTEQFLISNGIHTRKGVSYTKLSTWENHFKVMY